MHMNHADKLSLYIMAGLMVAYLFVLVAWGFIRAHRMRSGKMFGKGDRT